MWGGKMKKEIVSYRINHEEAFKSGMGIFVLHEGILKPVHRIEITVGEKAVFTTKKDESETVTFRNP